MRKPTQNLNFSDRVELHGNSVKQKRSDRMKPPSGNRNVGVLENNGP